MKNLIRIFLAITLATFASCSKVDTETELQQAERELKAGNIDMALSGCEVLTDSTMSTLTSTQMCRVAIIYAKASETSNNHNYMVAATECFDKAVQLDADTDSLEAYINSLGLEDLSVVNSIREVSQILKTPVDLSDRDYEQEEINS